MRLRIYYQHWIFRFWPMKNYEAICLGRFILIARPSGFLQPGLLEHELIHQEQMNRCGVFKFYVIYLKDYFKGLIKLRNHELAYRAIPFEKEAYRRSLAIVKPS